jgi:hypothetical protein
MLAYILHFIQIQLHRAALAFGESVCFALDISAASLAANYFVFDGHVFYRKPV